jgi:hypothetical protein
MKTKSVFPIRMAAIVSFFFITTAAFSQKESVVYVGTNGKLTTLDHAIYMQQISAKSPLVSIVQTFQLKDAKWDKICSENYKKMNDSTYQIKGSGENIKGTSVRFFVRQTEDLYRFKDVVKGNITRTGYAKSIIPLLLHGQVTEYYLNGNKKSVSEYNNNELISNKNWLENGDKYIDNIFYSVDIDPTFKPGKKVLQDHVLKYYKDAGIDISSISGSIIIGFVITENGTIDGIKILKGLGPNINNVTYESLLTLNLKGNWTTAKLNNQPVRYYQVFPINFIYKEYHFEYAELRGATIHYGAF